MEHLGRVEQGVQQTLQNIDIWNRQRLTASTRWASGEIQHAMESGQHGTGAAALTSLITDCQAVRHHEDHVLAERLEPYLVTLRELLHQAAKRLGVECNLEEHQNRTQSVPRRKCPDDKRQRVLDHALEREPIRDQMVQMLRDPSVTPPGVTASEHRLLATVIPESALLPDVAAMHDLYHPNASIYCTDGDRSWNERGTHLGFFGTTMMYELAVHRDMIRRFSFVHLLYQLGFGAADINFYVTYVDDTFYRRMVSDSRLGFVAEGCSPRIRLYRGQAWSRLLDVFLSNQHRDDGVPWTRLTRCSLAADEVVQEHTNTEIQQLIPSRGGGDPPPCLRQQHHSGCVAPSSRNNHPALRRLDVHGHAGGPGKPVPDGVATPSEGNRDGDR